jgi:glycosyltransferase involved in cell wall biosynthesis
MPSTQLKVALLAPSPIPFKVPLYRRIAAAEGIDLTVMYACSMGVRPATAGYTEDVVWDTELLDGYAAKFLSAADRTAPVAASVTELINPDVIPWLVRGRFDVLWSDGYSWITNQMAILTQRARRMGVVMRDEQTLLHPRGLIKTVLKEVALRSLFSTLDAAVYISAENRRWLEHYGIPPEHLFWCPYGADTDHFSAEAARLRDQRDALRARFGFSPEDGPIVVSVSRLAEAKQPQMLIEAFRRVRAKHRCGLLLVGSGPLEDELRDWVAREQIPDVRLTGFLNQSEVTGAYAAGDAFALLSAWNETFGVAVAEAMHFGLPLILSDKVGSAPDLLGDGSNGFIVPRDDVDRASQAIEALVADPDMRRRFGEASVSRVNARGLNQATEGAVRAIRFAADRGAKRTSGRGRGVPVAQPN